MCDRKRERRNESRDGNDAKKRLDANRNWSDQESKPRGGGVGEIVTAADGIKSD